jgi:hypothetical protein
MTDVLELLKQDDPVDATALRAQSPPAVALDAILASPARPPRRRRSRMRLLAPAAGLAAAAAAAVVLVAGGDGRTVDTAAAAALEEIADVARDQPAVLPTGDHRFLYFRMDSKGVMVMGDDRRPFLLEYESTQEVWAGDEDGLGRNRADAPRFATRADRGAWEAAGRPKLPGAVDERFRLDGIERLDIPTDPDALLDRLRERAADKDEENAWIFGTMITDYLREWGVTPEQRAALYEAAARVPGVELLGERRDPEGRAGVAFSMVVEQGTARQTIILDPDTGELLAETWKALPGAPGAEGYGATSVFHSPVLVDAVGELPR